MANFGFARLTVVTAYEPHWREARSAIGAPKLLQNAEETESLAEAVANCTLVIGTGTLTYRKPEQPVVSLPSLAPIVATNSIAQAALRSSLARKSMASPAKTSPGAIRSSRSPPILNSLP